MKIIHYFFFLFKDNDCIVFYISFDPFSLVDQKFNVCFSEKSYIATQRLKSKSIYNAISGSDISLESIYGAATSPPSSNIGDVFLFLKNQHQGQLVHFLVDELNQEVFTKSYASTLYNILESSFNESTIVIALQSVCKNRTIKSVDNENVYQSDPIDLENCELEIIQLKTSARMTQQLYKLQLNLQKEVEQNPFKATVTYKGKKILEYFDIVYNQIRLIPASDKVK